MNAIAAQPPAENTPGHTHGLRAHGICKRYGEVRALHPVDLDVRDGELVVLLGPNGAGKTTLFGILSGLIRADAGEVFVNGTLLTANPPRVHAATGLVFQQPALDLEMTVLDNLHFHASLHGLARDYRDTRIAALLAANGLDGRARHRARTLSGGNRRRVELIRALLHEPALLLMDEPTVGLDPASRRGLLRNVQDYCRRTRAGALWATHLLDETEYADRVIVLHHGEVLADVSPAQLRAMSARADVADAFLQLTGAEP